MKKLLSIVCFAFLLGSLNAQESLLTDIMNVDAVTAAENDDFIKADEEYTAFVEKEKERLDKDLEKLSSSFQKGVEKEIKTFQKVLDGAVEKEVNNQKRIVDSAVNASCINLKKDKKTAINKFAATLAIEIRNLPNKKLIKDKEAELVDLKKEYLTKVDQEFNANKKSVKDFLAKQHITDPEQ